MSRRNREQDVKLLTWLINETFKEHFNFRPGTVEETRHFWFSDLYYNIQEVFFAILAGEEVGYVGVGVDDKYNLEKHTRSGDIFSIGVLKKHRRTGIGARLILHGLDTLKAKGMTRALLGVDGYNPTKAIKPYEKVGFRVKKKGFTFEKQL